MELIPYNQFAKLRLKQFVDGRTQVNEMDGVEWLGGYGISEGIRGSDFFRWEKTPNETGAIAVYCADIPENVERKILDAINLPLRSGMKLEEIYSVLGKPTETDVFKGHLGDRQSDEFVVGSEQPYRLSVTVHTTDGLIYIAIVRGDILSNIEAEEAAFQAEVRTAQTAS